MVLLFCMFPGDFVNASDYFEENNFSFNGQKIQNVNLKNKNGLVLIKVTQSVNEINLKIRKEVSGLYDKSKARAYLDAIKEDLRLLNGGHQLYLAFEYPSITTEGNIKSDVIVEVPISFVARDWHISTGNGQIKVSNLEANLLSATIGNGQIELDHVHVKKTSDLRVGNGSLEINDISSEELEATVGNGQIMLSGFNKEISQVDLTVNLGNINSQLPLSIQQLGFLGQKGNYQPQKKRQSIKLHVDLGSISLQ